MNRSAYRLPLVAGLVLVLGLAACTSEGSPVAATDTTESATVEQTAAAAQTPETPDCRPTEVEPGSQAAEIVGLAEGYMEDNDLRSVLLSVVKDGETIVTAQMGQSLEDVEATTDMRFYNGAVAFTYLGTAALSMAEDGLIDLDEPISTYLPDVPSADTITLRMLLTSTSGYADYVATQSWIDELYQNPFRSFSTEELEAVVFDQPLRFEPGTNVGYSHLNFRLAGQIMATAADQPLDELLQEQVTEPLGLDDTFSVDTTDLPSPVLHTFTDERGFYEETTGWSPKWGVPTGAVMVTTICDLATSGAGIGSGELLSSESYEEFIDPRYADLGEQTAECPNCIPQSPDRYLALGTTVMGDWIVQTPLFTGIAAVQTYLPSEDLSIAVANTFGPGSDVGVNGSKMIAGEIAALLAPDSPLSES